MYLHMFKQNYEYLCDCARGAILRFVEVHSKCSITITPVYVLLIPDIDWTHLVV